MSWDTLGLVLGGCAYVAPVSSLHCPVRLLLDSPGRTNCLECSCLLCWFLSHRYGKLNAQCRSHPALFPGHRWQTGQWVSVQKVFRSFPAHEDLRRPEVLRKELGEVSPTWTILTIFTTSSIINCEHKRKISNLSIFWSKFWPAILKERLTL